MQFGQRRAEPDGFRLTFQSEGGKLETAGPSFLVCWRTRFWQIRSRRPERLVFRLFDVQRGKKFFCARQRAVEGKVGGVEISEFYATFGYSFWMPSVLSNGRFFV